MTRKTNFPVNMEWASIYQHLITSLEVTCLKGAMLRRLWLGGSAAVICWTSENGKLLKRHQASSRSSFKIEFNFENLCGEPRINFMYVSIQLDIIIKLWLSLNT